MRSCFCVHFHDFVQPPKAAAEVEAVQDSDAAESLLSLAKFRLCVDHERYDMFM